ncbi:uncharacterized protein PV07_10846 [Cladophialophora immunda]|uniref:CYTH domain-containing protein n=1 Tax=Cladophialophora immunda TaxID=569365 RepID=A0A0D2BU47_9EURO|nr:uncharacterized protein PV07_10846 [Cladophialophora immunda]KIW22558.1 hypothetical protein PV07_10846 [Cladophialophora immunda]
MPAKLVPDYEVKLLLKLSEVLGSNNKLSNAIVSEFDIASSTKKMNVQFIDTKDQDIYTSGWNLRIRKEEGENNFELTYKKRYSIGEEYSSTAGGHIDTALETAQQEGFDTTTEYKAQVEVGYQKQTLSISYDVEVPDEGSEGMDLPNAKVSRDLLTDGAPKEFENWNAPNWGGNHLVTSIVYGPVHAKRFKGNWDDGLKLSIEVWPIRKSKEDATLEPIVEASFKTSDLQKALKAREKIVELLQKKGWFLAKDSLKTKLIMERYGCLGE